MARLTQRDIVDTIMGLRTAAEDLRHISQGVPLEGMVQPGTVLARASTLQEISQYLSTAAEELLNLIPDKEIPIPPKG